ncbi:hypothetical protein F5Y18DRAFT_404476 [Xylariaceae sp. FL1019]|nr:hypothetical protein F5Y18DRAFT_404476 [Xylariaceae sp. FL1019]
MASNARGGLRGLPRTLKCGQCGEYKTVDQYAKNQITKWKKAENKSWVQLSCKAHQGAMEVAEKKCASCGCTKPTFTHFSKAQRNNPEAWCIACTEWKDSEAHKPLPARPNETIPYFVSRVSQELLEEHATVDDHGSAGVLTDGGYDTDETATVTVTATATATASVAGTTAGDTDAVDGFAADGYEFFGSSVAPSTSGDGNDGDHDDGFGADSNGVDMNTANPSSVTNSDVAMLGLGVQQLTVDTTGSRDGIESFSSRMSPPPSVHRSVQTSVVPSTTAITTGSRTATRTATRTRRAHGTGKFHKTNNRKDYSEREQYSALTENRADDPDSDDSIDEI